MNQPLLLFAIFVESARTFRGAAGPSQGGSTHQIPLAGPDSGRCCLKGRFVRSHSGTLALKNRGFFVKVQSSSVNTETTDLNSKNFSCEPHREGKETCLCPSTDRVRFRLFPSTVSAGREYGLDCFRVRFRYPLR